MGLKELIFGKQIKQAHAAQYRNSTQGWLPELDVQNGVIITKDGRYVKILEIMPVNFYLKSAIEQQNIIFYFSSYLKIAPDNLQIKIVTQKADIDGYVARMKARSDTLQGIAERLREEEQTARRYLDLCGLEVVSVKYADNFQLELLYSFINKKTSRHTRLPLGVYDMISRVHGLDEEELDALEKGGAQQDEAQK